jgi:glutaredoxin
MNRWKILNFVIFLLLFSISCNPAEKSEQEQNKQDHEISEKKEVIVYGSRTCPHCMVFIRKLDEAGIKYIFMEVDNDDANFREMYDKIKSVNFKGYVNYPVIDVGGEIMVNPDFDRFNEAFTGVKPGG